jgi:hypothetical protein
MDPMERRALGILLYFVQYVFIYWGLYYFNCLFDVYVSTAAFSLHMFLMSLVTMIPLTIIWIKMGFKDRSFIASFVFITHVFIIDFMWAVIVW